MTNAWQANAGQNRRWFFTLRSFQMFSFLFYQVESKVGTLSTSNRLTSKPSSPRTIYIYDYKLEMAENANLSRLNAKKRKSAHKNERADAERLQTRCKQPTRAPFDSHRPMSTAATSTIYNRLQSASIHTRGTETQYARKRVNTISTWDTRQHSINFCTFSKPVQYLLYSGRCLMGVWGRQKYTPPVLPPSISLPFQWVPLPLSVEIRKRTLRWVTAFSTSARIHTNPHLSFTMSNAALPSRCSSRRGVRTRTGPKHAAAGSDRTRGGTRQYPKLAEGPEPRTRPLHSLTYTGLDITLSDYRPIYLIKIHQ